MRPLMKPLAIRCLKWINNGSCFSPLAFSLFSFSLTSIFSLLIIPYIDIWYLIGCHQVDKDARNKRTRMYKTFESLDHFTSFKVYDFFGTDKTQLFYYMYSHNSTEGCIWKWLCGVSKLSYNNFYRDTLSLLTRVYSLDHRELNGGAKAT